MELKAPLRMLGLVAAVVAADQFSKLAATAWSPTGAGLTAGMTVGPFGILPIANPDAIGGLDVGASDLLPLAALVAVSILIALSRRLRGGSPLGAALAVAGAAGNMIDRVRVGHVIDFVSVELGGAQVILNLADVALFVGIPLLVLGGMRSPHGQPLPDRRAAGRDGRRGFASGGIGLRRVFGWPL